MEWKSETENIIAKLMGIEQLRPRQSLYKNQRGLSEGYIRKASAIAQRRGSRVSNRRTLMIKPENVESVKDVSPLEGGNDATNQESGPLMVTKMEPKLETVTCSFNDEMPKSLDREQNDFMSLEKGSYNRCHDSSLMSQKVVINGAASLECGCIEYPQKTNEISQKVPCKSKPEKLSIPACNSSAYRQDLESGHSSPLSPSQPSPKKQIFERWTRSRVVRKIEFSQSSESLKMLPLADKESMTRKPKDSPSSVLNLKKNDPVMEFEYVDNILEPRGGSNREEFQASVSVSDISEDIHDSHCDLTPRNSVFTSAEVPNEPQDFIVEALRNEFSEELTHSNSSQIGTPEFRENLKRANQHSPDSVLKPFHEHYDSDDQSLNSLDLKLQLQVLNLEAEDSNSEESVMDVSGDDDSEEHASDVAQDNRRVRRWIGDIESRNFSYMVDVLDEAGFCGANPCMDSKSWHSLECPISSSTFEALEKKYGKQASWEKAERRLLFDNINFGLMSIFNPALTFYPSAQRSVRPNLRREEVEDELWAMLIRQQKEISGNVLERWFETEEGMALICSELATSLFDELVEEEIVICSMKC